MAEGSYAEGQDPMLTPNERVGRDSEPLTPTHYRSLLTSGTPTSGAIAVGVAFVTCDDIG